MKLNEMISAGRGIDDLQRSIIHIKDIDEVSKEGLTSLMCAIKENYVSAVELLIEEGADVNIKNENGESALILARENGNKKIISLLLKAGASLVSEERL